MPARNCLGCLLIDAPGPGCYCMAGLESRTGRQPGRASQAPATSRTAGSASREGAWIEAANREAGQFVGGRRRSFPSPVTSTTITPGTCRNRAANARPISERVSESNAA